MTAGTVGHRLNAMDTMFLRLEKPAWPCHYGVLLLLDGSALLDPHGDLEWDAIVARLERRLGLAPRLRRRILEPGPFLGRPLWIDDDRFDLRAHLHRAPVQPPGGEDALMAAALGAYDALLDRSRPLWEMWFLTGMPDHRVGVLLKLHHTVADGLAALELTSALTDAIPGAPDPVPTGWFPGPVPTRRALARQHLGTVLSRSPRTPSATPGPPAPTEPVGTEHVPILRTLRGFVGSGGAAASSLNATVRAGRRVVHLDLDLADVKAVAHAHGGTANDVALALWTGGLRAVLAGRGQVLDGAEVAAGQTVTLRGAREPGTIDNQVGSVMLRLPVWEPEPSARLGIVVDRTRQAKAAQRPAAIMAILAALSATPLGRFYSAHQRAGNAICTNVRGPAERRYLLGAPILAIVPIIELVGNIALTQIAFSYAGRMVLATTADATAFPDLDVLVDAMRHEWATLIAGDALPSPHRRRAGHDAHSPRGR